MIHFLRIRNFQKFKLLEIDFDRDCTTLVGPTDAGKSAIIRALRWVCLNKPGGNSFTRHGAKFRSVEIHFDDHVLIRRKGKHNEYVLDGKTFRAFGADVPEPIRRVLGITDANFQRQHDAPFWFSASAGQVSKELNTIVNLGQIDTALQKAGALSRKAGTEVTTLKSQYEAAKAEVKKLKWIVQANKELAILEALSERRDQVRAESESLGQLLDEIEDLNVKAKPLSRAAKEAYSVLKTLQALTKVRAEHDSLDKLLTSIEDLKELEWTTKCSLSEVIQAKTELDLNKAQLDNLSDLLIMIEHASSNYSETQEELECLQRRVRKKLGKNCPVCGQKIGTSSPSKSRIST